MVRTKEGIKGKRSLSDLLTLKGEKQARERGWRLPQREKRGRREQGQMSKPGRRSQKRAPHLGLGIILSSEMHILTKLSPWEAAHSREEP